MTSPLSTHRLTVRGMTCGHCEASVRTALEQLPDASDIVVDRQQDTASVSTSASLTDAVAAVNAIGFEASA